MIESGRKKNICPLVSASLLGADWLKFGEAVKIAIDVKADLIQIDIADGIFTPTITFGEELVKRVKSICDIPIEIHLMVSNPQNWIGLLSEIGVDFILFHVEAVQRIHATIEQIRHEGIGVGVVLNTETIPEIVEFILPYVDIITVMAILPGFAGQPFIPETYEKIKRLRKMIDNSKNCSALIEVDGGIKQNNIEEVIRAGSDIVISSSGIYHSPNPINAVRELRESMWRIPLEQKREKNILNFLNKIEGRRGLFIQKHD